MEQFGVSDGFAYSPSNWLGFASVGNRQPNLLEPCGWCTGQSVFHLCLNPLLHSLWRPRPQCKLVVGFL